MAARSRTPVSPEACPPPGTVQVFHCPPRTVIWLRGEVDLALEPVLTQVVQSIPARDSDVVVDVARLRFGDLTLTHFIEQLRERGSVTVRFPSPLTSELLRTTGADATVQVQHHWHDSFEPGPFEAADRR